MSGGEMDILVDTSAIAAILNKKDKYHEEARAALQGAREQDDGC